MAYYNAALLPPDDLSSKMAGYVQAHYKSAADGYCLSNTVLPHITLCQFETDFGMPDLSVFNGTINIALLGFGSRHGKGIHEGYVWLELSVFKTAPLVELQESVAHFLSDKDINLLTKVGDYYHPHASFCRVKAETYSMVSSRMPDIDFFKYETPWRFSFGVSDVNGQYMGPAL